MKKIVSLLLCILLVAGLLPMTALAADETVTMPLRSNCTDEHWVSAVSDNTAIVKSFTDPFTNDVGYEAVAVGTAIVTITRDDGSQFTREVTVVDGQGSDGRQDQAPLTITSATTVVFGSELKLETSGGSGTGEVRYSVEERWDNTAGRADVQYLNDGAYLVPDKGGKVRISAQKLGDNDYKPEHSEPVVITITKAAPWTTGTDLTAEHKCTATGAQTKEIYGIVASSTTYTVGEVTDANHILSGTPTYDRETGDLVYTLSGTGRAGNTATIKVTVGSDNYQDSTITLTITMTKGDASGTPGFTAVSESGKTLEDVVLTADNMKPAGGAFQWVDENGDAIADPSEVAVEQNKAYKFKYTPQSADQSSFDAFIGTVTPWRVSPPVSSTPIETTTTVDGASQTTETASNGTVISTTTWSTGKSAVSTVAPTGEATVKVTSPTGETMASVHVPGTIPQSTKQYDDVKANDWFKQSVNDATALGLFSGTSATSFSPREELDRSMLVKALYNLSGEPGYGTGANTFGDVPANTWYTDAADWAGAMGVASGTEKGFEPNVSITRQDMVTMLYRFAMAIGADPKDSAGLGKFADGGKVSDYARAAMQWAVSTGIIGGKGSDILDPKGTATRAEAAAVLVRFTEYLKK